MTVARPISSAQDFVFNKGAAGDAELTVLGGLNDQRGAVGGGQSARHPGAKVQGT